MNQQAQQLESLLRDRGLAWAVDMFAPSSEAAAYYLDALDRLERYVAGRELGSIPFSPESLRKLAAVSSYKADAFLQALVSIRSTPILCAAWRILQGMEIASVEMRYVRLSHFELRVVLCSPYDGTEEKYESDDINDAVFVRHLGQAKLDTKPLFDGFYALRQK